MTTKPGQNPTNAGVWSRNLALAHACPRCGARTRSGLPCKAQAMRNGRCYRHGGASTGPRTPEGLQRIVKARTVHGGYSAESRRVAGMIRDLKAEAKRFLRPLEQLGWGRGERTATARWWVRRNPVLNDPSLIFRVN